MKALARQVYFCKIQGSGWGVAAIDIRVLVCRMGRVKLKIKKLESTSNRQVTYSKRKNGIMKKANELSILCDIDIVLLMFSPTGRPTLFNGHCSNIEEVIAKFDQLTPQERAKRKLEGLEALKKTFKKLDHDVNIQDFLGGSSQSVEELTDQVRLLQSQLTEIHKRLSYWSSPDKIDNLEHLRQMEDSIRESMSRIRLYKENFERHQLMSLECTGQSCINLSSMEQFQNGMGLPLILGGVQEAQPLSWLPNDDNQYMMLHSESNFLPHRGIECLADASIPGYSGYFGNGKQSEIGNTGEDIVGQQGIVLNRGACFGEQYAYPPYNLSMQDDKKTKCEMEMNLQGSPVDYQVGGNFELSGPVYDGGNQQWVSTSTQNGIALFKGNNTYHHQQQN